MTDRDEALSLLGLNDGFSPDQLTAAYRRLLKTFGPDRDPEGFVRLRQAYELLSAGRRPARSKKGRGARAKQTHPVGRILDRVEDALDAGRFGQAVNLLLDSLADAEASVTFSASAPLYVVNELLLHRVPHEAWRLLAPYRAWLEQYALEPRLRDSEKTNLGTLAFFATLSSDMPAEVLDIIAQAIVLDDLFPLKARLREFAVANPADARRAHDALPEINPVAEKMGLGPTPIASIVRSALDVPERNGPAEPLDLLFARARSLIESARTEDRRAMAWRAVHDLVQGQPIPMVEALVPLLEPLLADWPDELRATMCESPWDADVMLGAPDPAHRLIRYLRYDSIFFGRDEEMRIRSPNLDTDDARRLAESPIARGLTRIKLSGQSFSRAAAEALAKSPHFVNLEDLDLSSSGLGNDGVVALARGRFPRLRVMRLSSNRAGPKAAQAWAEFGRLEELDLSGNPIGSAAALAQAPIDALRLGECELSATELPEFLQRELDLSDNALGPESGTQIRGAALRRLDLTDNALGDAGAAALELPHLEHLGLRSNGITTEGIRALRVSAKSLDLHGNAIGDAGLDALLRSGGVSDLDLGECGVTGAGVSGDLSGVTALDLRDNALVGLDWLSRARSLEELTLSSARFSGVPRAWWPKLRTLMVFECDPDDRDLALVPSKKLWLVGSRHGDRTLFELLEHEAWRPEVVAFIADLGNQGPFGAITDEGVMALASSPAASAITELQLTGHRGITDRGALSLARSPYLRNLLRLKLRCCSIGDRGIVALLEHHSLLSFDVEGNPYGAEATAALDRQPARCCP